MRGRVAPFPAAARPTPASGAGLRRSTPRARTGTAEAFQYDPSVGSRRSPAPEAAPFGTQVTERLVEKASGVSRYARARCRTGVWRSPAPRANEGGRPLRGLSSRDVASPFEPAAHGPRIPSGRSIGFRSDSPRSGRPPSLARGAGERQTPVRGVRSADRSRNTLDSGRSSTCVPNGAEAGVRARGSGDGGALALAAVPHPDGNPAQPFQP